VECSRNNSEKDGIGMSNSFLPYWDKRVSTLAVEIPVGDVNVDNGGFCVQGYARGLNSTGSG
jgi:hypothetical protein